MSEEIKNETAEEVSGNDVLPARMNPLCVVSKEATENGWRDVQSSSGWTANPYGDGYAVVRDELVPGILATDGYLDPVFSEDGAEVVNFTPLEKPESEPDPAAEPTVWDELDAAYQEGVDSV